MASCEMSVGEVSSIYSSSPLSPSLPSPPPKFSLPSHLSRNRDIAATRGAAAVPLGAAAAATCERNNDGRGAETSR